MPPFIPKLNTPYKNLAPPLTEEEDLALEADIQSRGLLHRILIDESNNILDGHHRYGMCCRLGVHCSTKVITGLESDLEKRLFVLQSNFKRRNLDQAARKTVRQQQIEIYGELRQKDPKKWTLDKIAKECGVALATAAEWFSNFGSGIAKQDARRKIPVEKEQEIRQDLESGDSTSEVAKKHGVSKGRISQIRKHGKKPSDVVCLEDREMEELIAKGEDHLRQAVDCFVPFDDEVAAAAINEILGEWFDF
jgi:ParB-like chromosome segregation protein Spo0J